MQRETIVTKNEEKIEILNTLFTSAFNSKTSCSPGAQNPELEDRDRELNEAPIIQGKMVNNLLQHLDTSLWDWMGFTQGDSEAWWKFSPSPFQSFTNSSG